MTTIRERAWTLQQLEASGLRGRGGGWFPTHKKWRAVLAEDGVPFVVANGGESEPGSIKDRLVMRTRADEVVRGLKLAIDTLGAERGYLYLKGSFHEEEKRLNAAIGALGLGELITIHRGDDTYVGGEETALLESIEGRVAWPRPKPPRPAAVGLFGRPTLVQNVDTLARVAQAARLGSQFPASETITLSVWGDVSKPGAYEVPFGRTLRSVIDGEAGGAASDIGLVFPNGAQSPPLLSSALEVRLTPDDLGAAGSSLGLASILVLNASTDPVSILRAIARFFERESCAQCPPCILGAANLRSLIEGDRQHSTNRLTPQAAIRETAWFMSMHGYCGHARAGASAVTGLFERWQGPVLERIRTGALPTGAVERDPFAPASEERRALDAFLEGVSPPGASLDSAARPRG